MIEVDGVRVLFGDGWGLIRASNTQPVIVARYEATNGVSASPPSRARWRDGCATKAYGCKMTRRRWLMFALGVAAVLLIFGAVAGVYADYLWYESLGTAASGAPGAAIAPCQSSALLSSPGPRRVCNLSSPCDSRSSRLVFPRRLANLEIGEEVPGRYIMASPVALFARRRRAARDAADDWTTVVLAPPERHSRRNRSVFPR